MTGRPSAAACARRSASRSLAPATLFDMRALTPMTTSRLRAIAPRARSTFARVRSCSSPPGATPVRAMLIKQRPICGAPRATAAAVPRTWRRFNMADGLHTRLKRGSWTRGISLSTAGGYRRASRRPGVSFTIELVILALASGLLGLDGTAYAATKDSLYARLGHACRLWVRLGPADYRPAPLLHGRCSLVSGPIPERPDQAALAKQPTLDRRRDAAV